MAEHRERNDELIFALDIGTRSIVGVVGKPAGNKIKVLAVEMAEHDNRTMLDGQIDDILGVASLARKVTERLESRLETHLKKVCVAAAGRALRTQKGSFSIELEENSSMSANDISRLEAGAVSQAEEALQEDEDARRQFYLVGYTVSQYRLDNYPLTTLLDHSGKKAEADVVATFLPGEVVESLYASMRAAGLQVSSLTLEPIAAMNAAIPADLRLLNLALVDIGAGTSDIAICRDGSVVGYTMVTQAGDEITETIMRTCLVDFQTAEQLKRALAEQELLTYTNILGFEESITSDDLRKAVDEPMSRLADAISQQILEINGGPPSALFMAGGGSKLSGLREKMTACMGMDQKRVALAGSNFAKSVFCDDVDLNLNNPEYTTPLGIAISAGMGLLNDSYIVLLNGQPAKLFRNGALTLKDILLMNGYTYTELVGKTGKSLGVTLDGKHLVFRGEPAAPAILRVNGKDEPITAVVHAGDQIDFTPAKAGADAAKTLADVLESGFKGRVLLNNETAALDTPLRQGDVILTLEKPAPPEERRPAPPAVPRTVTAAAVSAPIVMQNAAPRASASRPAPSAAPQKPKVKPLRVILNGMPIDLPAKADGEPYYLMDLLKYSGIDFQNLDRQVRIELNGAQSSFQSVLHEQDSVIICYV